MKCIIYKNETGGICIVYPVSNCGLSLSEIIIKDVPPNVEYKVIENNLIPKDSFFRDSWELEGESIKVNLEKAKEIWKDIWRSARKPILEKLDLEWMRAMEMGDAPKSLEIVQRKQELRDITNTNLNFIHTPEDLKNFWPSCLK